MRRCSVWKNGISWLCRKGVATTVEVIEQNTVVSLTISCLTNKEMECVEHRSQVINSILAAKEELCRAVAVDESFIDSNTHQPFSICELAEAILENESILVSQRGQKMVEIDQLLYFEPYNCLSGKILRELIAVSENGSDKLVSEAFVDGVGKISHRKVDQLKQALGIDIAKLQAALVRAPPFQRDQPEYQCKLVFQVWKESTQCSTYGALRSALDKYSVFNGRNILVSVRICGCPVCAELCNIQSFALNCMGYLNHGLLKPYFQVALPRIHISLQIKSGCFNH